MNQQPDFESMTADEISDWLAHEYTIERPNRLWRAWQEIGMRKTISRVFRERVDFPLGSKDRLERQETIRVARQSIREIQAERTSYETFEVTSEIADLLHIVCQERGITPVEFITEAIRMSLWSKRDPEGVQAIQHSTMPNLLFAEAERVYGAIWAAGKALDSKLPDSADCGLAVIILSETADTLRSHAVRITPELRAELTRLEHAAALLKTATTADLRSWGGDGLNITIEPSKKFRQYHEMRFESDRHGFLARVLLPPVNVATIIAVDQLHAVFYQVEDDEFGPQ